MSLSFIASAGRQPGHTTRYRPHVYTKRRPAITPDDNRRYLRERRPANYPSPLATERSTP